MYGKLRLIICAALVGAGCSTTHRQIPQSNPQPRVSSTPTAPRPLANATLIGVTREYEGLYTVSLDEDRFVPCGIPEIGDGWAIKFLNPRQAIFIGRETLSRGSPPLSHFIRLRGKLDSPGRYNRGFQTRQLIVDSVLSVRETQQPCATYEDLPEQWNGLGKGQVRSATFSDDWKLAALVDSKGDVSIWSVGTAQKIRNLGHIENVQPELLYKVPMAFSADNELLFAGGNDAIVRVWNLRDGNLLYTLDNTDSTPGYNDIAHNAAMAIRGIALNESETELAVMTGWTTRVWSLATRRPIAEYGRRMGALTRAFFDEGSLLIADDTGTISSYRPPGGQRQWVAKTGSRTSQYSSRSANGEWIALNGWGDSIFLWSVSEQSRGPTLNIPASFGGAGAMAFSPDGKILATSGGMYGLYLWELGSGNPIRSFHGYPGPVYDAWFTPDGKSIVTYSVFDSVFRIVHLDATRNVTAPVMRIDSTAAVLVFPPNQARTIAGVVKGPNQRAVPSADVELMDGDAPDVVVQRAVTSPGGYFSFNGVRFPHVIIRVRKPGFQEGLLYVHQRRFYLGPSEIELKPAG